VGEVFPLAVRSQAIALATFVNFASNFAVSLVLPSLQESVGMRTTYAVFAAIGVAAVANIYYNVPETKNKTLEQIEAMWRR
jgi:multidrug transporter EmrE-like cation transporter